MSKQAFPLGNVYSLLEPGPVVLLVTAGAKRPNVMPMSWLTMLEFEPPLVGIVVSQNNYSFGLLAEGKACSLNIPTAELAEQVVGCGNCSGREVDKFARFGLTTHPAQTMTPPLLEQCYASLECRLVDASMAEHYNLFVLEVVQAWVDPTVKAAQTLHHRGYGTFMLAGNEITLPSRMK